MCYKSAIKIFIESTWSDICAWSTATMLFSSGQTIARSEILTKCCVFVASKFDWSQILRNIYNMRFEMWSNGRNGHSQQCWTMLRPFDQGLFQPTLHVNIRCWRNHCNWTQISGPLLWRLRQSIFDHSYITTCDYYTFSMYSRSWLVKKHRLILNIQPLTCSASNNSFLDRTSIQKNNYWTLSCPSPGAANNSNLKARENKINKMVNFA